MKQWIKKTWKSFYGTFGGVGIVGLIISLTAFILVFFYWDFLENKEKVSLFGGAVASGLVLVGLGLNAKRIQQQGKQLETQEKGLYAERLKSAITLLSNEAVSVQLGAISLLHTLAQEVPGTEEEKKKKRKEIQEVLCSFVRTETSTEEYMEQVNKKADKPSPSDIVRKILNIVTHRRDEGTPLFNAAEIDLSSAYLRGADLSGAYMQGANLIKADLQEADLQRANLQEAKLQKADLQKADLSGAYLQGANLTKADLQGAYLIKADLQGANLQDADLQGARMQEADLRRSKLFVSRLQGAALIGAALQGADVRLANLQEAYLEEANLKEADLQGADLQRANLQGVDLQSANLSTAKIDGGHKEWITGLEKEGIMVRGINEIRWV
ncbi:MAG: pentapeptide repeat-containing protein [Ekhidna sp.]|nr:pentapeptide repeat-containing protein [Ekhidna sp.]